MGEFLITQRSQRSDGSGSADWGVVGKKKWEEVAIQRLDKDS